MADIPAYDFSLKKGDTENETFTFYDDEARTLKTDLTSYSADLQLRENHNSTAIITLSDSNGGITLGGVLGTLVLEGSKIATEIAAATHISLPFTGYYDLQLTYPSGVVKTMFAGKITIAADYTT